MQPPEFDTHQPTDFRRNHQLAPSVGIRFFCSFLFHDKRLMVRTRSRATSPGHQGSRNASSNPHRGPQSAPAMQTSSAQHVQSMAAAMAELTRQNQELRMEINLRRQAREEREGGGQTQSHDDRENVEIGSQLRGTTS